MSYTTHNRDQQRHNCCINSYVITGLLFGSNLGIPNGEQNITFSKSRPMWYMGLLSPISTTKFAKGDSRQSDCCLFEFCCLWEHFISNILFQYTIYPNFSEEVVLLLVMSEWLVYLASSLKVGHSSQVCCRAQFYCDRLMFSEAVWKWVPALLWVIGPCDDMTVSCKSNLTAGN